MPRPARSLDVLLAQVNAIYPSRPRANDGWIGDLRHQRSKSEHNPNALGIVRARDYGCTPEQGNVIAACALATLKARGQKGYVIWNRRIANPSVQGGAWRKYNGSNPHDHHVHVSVLSRVDDRTPWLLHCPAPAKPLQQGVPAPPWPLPRTHRIGPNPKRRATWHDGTGTDTAGEVAIRAWQCRMKARGWAVKVDGVFGPACTKVLKAFQREKGLVVDGVLGPKSWSAAWVADTTA